MALGSNDTLLQRHNSAQPSQHDPASLINNKGSHRTPPNLWFTSLYFLCRGLTKSFSSSRSKQIVQTHNLLPWSAGCVEACIYSPPHLVFLAHRTHRPSLLLLYIQTSYPSRMPIGQLGQTITVVNKSGKVVSTVGFPPRHTAFSRLTALDRANNSSMSGKKPKPRTKNARPRLLQLAMPTLRRSGLAKR
jgi:hypothetical protein